MIKLKQMVTALTMAVASVAYGTASASVILFEYESGNLSTFIGSGNTSRYIGTVSWAKVVIDLDALEEPIKNISLNFDFPQAGLEKSMSAPIIGLEGLLGFSYGISQKVPTSKPSSIILPRIDASLRIETDSNGHIRNGCYLFIDDDIAPGGAGSVGCGGSDLEAPEDDLYLTWGAGSWTTTVIDDTFAAVPLPSGFSGALLAISTLLIFKRIQRGNNRRVNFTPLRRNQSMRVMIVVYTP